MKADGTIIMGSERFQLEGMKNMLGAEVALLQSKEVEIGEAVIYIRAHKDCPTGKVQEIIKECQLEEVRAVRVTGRRKSGRLITRIARKR